MVACSIVSLCGENGSVDDSASQLPIRGFGGVGYFKNCL